MPTISAALQRETKTVLRCCATRDLVRQNNTAVCLLGLIAKALLARRPCVRGIKWWRDDRGDYLLAEFRYA